MLPNPEELLPVGAEDGDEGSVGGRIFAYRVLTLTGGLVI